MQEIDRLKNQFLGGLTELRQRVLSADEALEQSMARLDLLLGLTRHLTLDLDALLGRLLRELGEVLPSADIRVVYLFEPGEKRLLPCACVGYDEKSFAQIRLQPGESTSGKVFQQGESVLLRTPEEVEAQAGALRPRNQALYLRATHGARIQSTICAPLRTAAERIIGTISLSSTRAAFDEDDLPLLEGVAGQITQAIANAQLFSALRESEEKYRLLLEHLPVGVAENTPEGRVIYQNPHALEINGYTLEELKELNVGALYVDPGDRESLLENLQSKGVHTYEQQLRRKDGHVVWVRGTMRALRDESGEVSSYLGIMEDTTEAHNREKRRQVLGEVRQEVWKMEGSEDIGKVLAAVRCGLEALEISFQGFGINRVDPGTDPAAVRLQSLTDEGRLVEVEMEETREAILHFWQSETPVYRPDLESEDPHGELAFLRRTFGYAVRSVLDVPFLHGTVALNSAEADAFSQEEIAFVQELSGVLSEGFRRLDDLKALALKEEQLRQAQKMEAVGHLAGGIAHDFNNLITIIKGYSELLLHDLDAADLRHRYAARIDEAGERAATLVRQLLIFSRRQVVQPELVDLNAVVAAAEQLLRRLIGENIELVAALAPRLKSVCADRGQLEQVVVNLAVNARDAMPRGGKLTIETATVELDESYTRRYVDLEPGPYVLLAVSDTGTGMDAETQRHIFDPFFTTKEPDKGTGLGLATVYGIIKQARGHIRVYSEVGAGASFKIYLPCAEGAEGGGSREPLAAVSAQGEETILVVEDEELVRELACGFLRENGYTVLEAREAEEALQVGVGHAGSIHLLLSDVIMPGMSGTELAARLNKVRPQLKVLYMSGYTDSAIKHHGVLEEGMEFLQKPFTSNSLARKVREVLDGT